MLSHYFKTALIHFLRYRVTTLINVVCLAIGLICFLAAHWLVAGMTSADRYFPGSEQIQVITQKITVAGSELSLPTMPLTAWKAGPHLREDIPELETVARATLPEQAPVKAGANKTFVQVRYADPDFLKVFAFHFLKGDGTEALRQVRSAVITEETAVRLFGSVDSAFGSRFLLQGKHELVITGVIAPVASPSHMDSTSAGGTFRFDVLASMDVYEAAARDNLLTDSTIKYWSAPATLTFVVLPRDGSLTAASLSERLKTFAGRHIPTSEGKAEFGAIPLSSLMVNFMNIGFGTEKTGLSSVTVVYMLAGLVLLISCLNYANLATAQATARAKEIGMRRVVGAHRGQIIAQHLLEAGLQSFVSLVIALGGFALILAARSSPGTSFVASIVLGSFAFWGFLLILWTAVTLASGAYPAFVLSRIAPVQAVRGGPAKAGSRRAPSVLVGAQFGMASFLVIAILVMQDQNEALTRSALGGMTNPVVVLPSSPKSADVSFDTLRSELLTQPHVESVTGSVMPPWGRNTAVLGISETGETQSRRWKVCYNAVNYDFFETVGFKLLAGRVFDRTFADGPQAPDGELPQRIRSTVIDRALAAQLGWTQPQAALGKTIHIWWSGEFKSPVRVVGVVETKPLGLIGVGATSNFFLLEPDQAWIPSIRVSPSNVPAALREIDAVWDRLAPNVPIKRQFADEVWNEAYAPFRQTSGAFSLIAMLAFVNAILGLIGMSLHVVSRRTHEIGVRKTLGASAARVFAMLLRDSSKPPLIANLIAWPFAFLVAQGYLSLFTSRVSLSVMPFAVGLAATMLVAWAAVAVQSMRAARLNPAGVLRYE